MQVKSKGCLKVRQFFFFVHTLFFVILQANLKLYKMSLLDDYLNDLATESIIDSSLT